MVQFQVNICYGLGSSLPKLVGSDADMSLSEDTEAVSVVGLNKGLPKSTTEKSNQTETRLANTMCITGNLDLID